MSRIWNLRMTFPRCLLFPSSHVTAPIHPRTRLLVEPLESGYAQQILNRSIAQTPAVISAHLATYKTRETIMNISDQLIPVLAIHGYSPA